MKFLHTGDLHLGKTLNDFSLLEDQREILRQIADAAKSEKVDAVLLSGDIYDRAVPPAEAVTLLNDFLTQLVREKIPVLLISGNHDSPERLCFAQEILEREGVYIAGTCDGHVKEVTLRDGEGPVAFVLLPFVKPSAVDARDSGEAVQRILSSAKPPEGKEGRKVLLTHFFVTDHGKEPQLSDSETTLQVGGLDRVEASLFADFDYVALGHIHRPQQVGEGPVYYAGAPLAYSFSEAENTKTMNLAELTGNGELSVRQLPFTPLHGMRRIRGRLSQLTLPEVVGSADPADYIQAVLTDEEELIDPMATLRNAYPNLMQILLAKNERTGRQAYESRLPERRKSVTELFTGFYELLREEEPDEERRRVIEQTAREAQEENL